MPPKDKREFSACALGIAIAFLFLSVQAKALQLDLIANSDRCVYVPKLDKDYCYSIYEIDLAKNPSVGIYDGNKASVLFKTDLKSAFSTHLYGLEATLTAIKKGGKIIINITAYKIPWQNVDNVFCYSGDCDYTKAWWNSSFGIKYPINATSYGSAAVTGFFLVNDTFANITGNVTEEQLIWCNYTVPVNLTTIGYLYVNSSSLYACINANETDRVGMIIDQGNGTNYMETNLDPSLLGWYTMNDTAGKDLSIYKRILTNNGGATMDTGGKIGYANNFVAASGQYYASANQVGYQTGTFSAWIYPHDTVAGALAAHASSFSWTTINWYAPLSISGTTWMLDFNFGNGASQICTVSSGYTSNTNAWYHVAATWNTTGCYLYINGAMNKSSTRSAEYLNNDYPLRIGSTTQGGQYFDGLMDNVMYFNRTLGKDEMRALYDNGHGNRSFMPLGAAYLFSNETEIPPDEPEGNITNLTLPYTANFCYDSQYLYARERVINETGDTLISEYLIYCEYGCMNSTFRNLGSPGCRESPMMLVVFAFIFVIFIIMIGRVAFK